MSRFVSLVTRWNMLASRRILLKHFDARAEEYQAEISGGHEAISETGLDHSGSPVCFFVFSILSFLTLFDQPLRNS